MTVRPALFPTSHQPHVSGSKRRILLPVHVKATCTFSDCGRYRTKLKHVWDSTLPLAMLAMKNPADAGTQYTDATVSKGSRIFARLGYGGLLVGNSCAFVSTLSSALLAVDDPVGKDNLRHIREMAEEADMIVVAHGSLPGQLQCHADAMVETLLSVGKDLYVLGLSDSGVPLHPLARGKKHVPENVVPQLWRSACLR
jgi:hypothetical protein